jgi:hypothetical protein
MPRIEPDQPAMLARFVLGLGPVQRVKRKLFLEQIVHSPAMRPAHLGEWWLALLFAYRFRLAGARLGFAISGKKAANSPIAGTKEHRR